MRRPATRPGFERVWLRQPPVSLPACQRLRLREERAGASSCGGRVRRRGTPRAIPLGGGPSSIFCADPPGPRIRTRLAAPAAGPAPGSAPRCLRGPTRRSESSRVIPTNWKGGLQAPFPIGRGERIRTSDLSVPNRALYQAEPRPDEGSTVPEGGRGRPALTRARGRGRPARGAGPPGGAGRRAGSRGPGGRVRVQCRGDRRGRSGGP